MFEERTVFTEDGVSTRGTLDPDHPDLTGLGSRNHIWFHRNTGLPLRIQRDSRIESEFSFLNVKGEAHYQERWVFELTSLEPGPLPPGWGEGGAGGAAGAGGTGGG